MVVGGRWWGDLLRSMVDWRCDASIPISDINAKCRKTDCAGYGVSPLGRRNYAENVPTFRIYGRLMMAYRILVAPLIGEVAFGWAVWGGGVDVSAVIPSLATTVRRTRRRLAARDDISNASHLAA